MAAFPRRRNDQASFSSTVLLTAFALAGSPWRSVAAINGRSSTELSFVAFCRVFRLIGTAKALHPNMRKARMLGTRRALPVAGS